LQAPKSHRGLRPWRRAAHPLRRPLPRHAAGAPARRLGVSPRVFRGPDGPVAAAQSPPGYRRLDPDHPRGRAWADRGHRESVPVVSGAGAGLLREGVYQRDRSATDGERSWRLYPAWYMADGQCSKLSSARKAVNLSGRYDANVTAEPNATSMRIT